MKTQPAQHTPGLRRERRCAVKHVLNIILPNIQAAMTGVWRIQRAHDLVTLEYTDGTREAGIVKLPRWIQIADNPFAIVSEVQSQRVPAQA